jgi:hypothetical protein
MVGLIDVLLVFAIFVISCGLIVSMYFNYKQFQDFTNFKESSDKQDDNLETLFKKVNDNDQYLKSHTDELKKTINKNKSQMATLNESIKPILDKEQKDSKTDSKTDSTTVGGNVKKGIDDNKVSKTVSNKLFNDFKLNSSQQQTDDNTNDTTDDKPDTNEAFSPILPKVLNSQEILQNLYAIIHS